MKFHRVNNEVVELPDVSYERAFSSPDDKAQAQLLLGVLRERTAIPAPVLPRLHAVRAALLRRSAGHDPAVPTGREQIGQALLGPNRLGLPALPAPGLVVPAANLLSVESPSVLRRWSAGALPEVLRVSGRRGRAGRRPRKAPVQRYARGRRLRHRGVLRVQRLFGAQCSNGRNEQVSEPISLQRN